MTLRADPTLMLELTNGRFVETASDTPTIYPLQNVLFAGTTAYCKIVIAKNPTYGKIFFLDEELQSAESDQALYHEMLVHPIMNATYAPDKKRRVLVVGAGEGVTVQEVLKWPDIEEVVWVDIDGDLVDMCRRHLAWTKDETYNDPRLRFIANDIREVIPALTHKYDVILLDLPDPDAEEITSDVNALYGESFWTLINSVLAPGGGIASHVGSIAPGENEAVQRPGLHLLKSRYGGHGYHCPLPSFQGEWGFWMSVPPNTTNHFPSTCDLMDDETQTHAFAWPRYWTSPRLGV